MKRQQLQEQNKNKMDSGGKGTKRPKEKLLPACNQPFKKTSASLQFEKKGESSEQLPETHACREKEERRASELNVPLSAGREKFK